MVAQPIDYMAMSYNVYYVKYSMYAICINELVTMLRCNMLFAALDRGGASMLGTALRAAVVAHIPVCRNSSGWVL